MTEPTRYNENEVRIKEYGLVTITSRPQEAEIILDGVLIGRTPANKLKLEAGDYTLELRKPGYTTWKRKVRILSDSEITLNGELER
jgi:hypothetical protein